MDSRISGDQAQAAMAADGARLVALKCHSGTATAVVHRVFANARVMRDGGIAFTYLLEGDLSRLCIPSWVTGGRADGLWQHTCFEAFVAAPGAAGYREFNFAPSGDWADYAFARYRERIPVANTHGPEVRVHMGEGRLEVDAIVTREQVPEDVSGAGWRIGLSAVIEDDGGVLSYWALEHPPGKPDFHHPDGFALALQPPLPFGDTGAADGGKE